MYICVYVGTVINNNNEGKNDNLCNRNNYADKTRRVYNIISCIVKRSAVPKNNYKMNDHKTGYGRV